MNKLTTTTKIIIGLAVGGVAYAGYRFLLKPYLEKRKLEKLQKENLVFTQPITDAVITEEIDILTDLPK
jgi:hypothetical protein